MQNMIMILPMCKFLSTYIAAELLHSTVNRLMIDEVSLCFKTFLAMFADIRSGSGVNQLMTLQQLPMFETPVAGVAYESFTCGRMISFETKKSAEVEIA